METEKSKRLYAFLFDNLLLIMIFVWLQKKFLETNEVLMMIKENSSLYYVYNNMPKLAAALVAFALVVALGGQSIAKRALKIRVVHNVTGEPIKPLRVYWREGFCKYFLWVVTLGVWWYIEFVVALFRKDNRSLHDLMSNTKVVDWEEREKKKENEERNKKGTYQQKIHGKNKRKETNRKNNKKNKRRKNW